MKKFLETLKRFVSKKRIEQGEPVPLKVTTEVLASEKFRKRHPNNCPVPEVTADGRSVGICWFYLKNNTCPRHGKIPTECSGSDNPYKESENGNVKEK